MDLILFFVDLVRQLSGVECIRRAGHLVPSESGVEYFISGVDVCGYLVWVAIWCGWVSGVGGYLVWMGINCGWVSGVGGFLVWVGIWCGWVSIVWVGIWSGVCIWCRS